MKLFADYLKERRGRELLELEYGFVTYEMAGEECYIVDIYVAPEMRQTGLGSKLADQVVAIAREKKCTYLKGTVDLRTNGARASCLALLHYGFVPVRALDEVIYFRKDL